MQHFDGARLSPHSVRNAVWRALSEPVCQYLGTRNPRCSTVYIDNSLGPLARDHSVYIDDTQRQWPLQKIHMLCLTLLYLSLRFMQQTDIAGLKFKTEWLYTSLTECNRGATPKLHIWIK